MRRFLSGLLLFYFSASVLLGLQQTRGLKVAPAPANATQQLPAGAKRFALIIGVDEYQDGRVSRLEGAAADAQTLASALIEYAGFPAQQVVLLATNQPADRQPTRGTILRRLSNLRGTVPADGLLLLAFAGHGIERGGRAYLLPTDAQVGDDVSLLEDTAISVESVRERITQTGVQQVLLILDACRNDPTAGRGVEGDNLMSNTYTRQFNFDQTNKGISASATLYATEVGHRAYEYKEKRQGYFTWALVEGLKGAAASPSGTVTLGSLLAYVQDVVPTRVKLDIGGSAQQRPFAVVSGYRAENLVLSAPKPAANPVASPAATPAANPLATAAANPLANPVANPLANPLASSAAATPKAPTPPPATPPASLPPAKPADASAAKKVTTLTVTHMYGVLPDHQGKLEIEDGSLRYHEEPPEHDFGVACKEFVSVKGQSRIADPKQEMVTLQLKNRASYNFRTQSAAARDQLMAQIGDACSKK